MAQIGIDLGTTNSLIGYMSDAGPKLIPNALGSLLTPSVVSLDGDEIIVGAAAKERLSSHPHQTAAFFKRHMGTNKAIKLGKKSFSAEELSSFILRSLKADAEKYLEMPITHVVISTPAYFNDAQRKAIMNAASLADLHVDLLINEPTAAALAYGAMKRQDESHFLIFDLGGGTFDVSVLEIFDDIVEVKASAGDCFLGGEDFIDIICAHFVKQLELKTLLKKPSSESLACLRKIAEQALFALDKEEKTHIDFILDDKKYNVDLSRTQLKELSQPLLEKIRRPIERSLNDSALKVSDLDHIFFVGGATRMPLIHSLVGSMFNMMPNRSLHPDQVVALGAAVQAGLYGQHKAVKDMVMTDICPFSLGIESGADINGKRIDDIFTPIIERNTVIPVSREQYFSTVHDGQSQIKISIYQGESPIASENLKLKETEIEVPQNKAGQETIGVRFTYDPSGLLDVDIKVLSTGKSHNLLIEQKEGCLTKAEIEDKRKQLAKLKILPKDKEEYRFLLEKLNNLYSSTLGEDREYVGQLMAEYRQILDTQDLKSIKVESALLKQKIDEIEKILKRV